MEYITGISNELQRVLQQIRDEKSISVGADAFAIVVEVPFSVDFKEICSFKYLPKHLLKALKKISNACPQNLTGGVYNITLSQKAEREPLLVQYNFLCFGDGYKERCFGDTVTNTISQHFEEFGITLSGIVESGQLIDAEEANQLKVWKPVSTILDPMVSQIQFENWKRYLKLHQVSFFGVLKDIANVKAVSL